MNSKLQAAFSAALDDARPTHIVKILEANKLSRDGIRQAFVYATSIETLFTESHGDAVKFRGIGSGIAPEDQDAMAALLLAGKSINVRFTNFSLAYAFVGNVFAAIERVVS
jgi:hypothetical protein